MALLEGDGLLSCSVVMKAAGISRNALFNYERHGAVCPQRDANGYRRYSEGDLLDVMCCTMLTSMGYSVEEASELLRQGDDVMSSGHIDAYISRLTRERDVVQAKLDNLAALRRATDEARMPRDVHFELVDCPEWLFFFDRQESFDLNDGTRVNQMQLMRSVPLACRGFTIARFFAEGESTYCWARTLRRAHERLLDIEAERACVLGGRCVRTVVRGTYPDIDPECALRDGLSRYMDGESLRVVGDPFVPLLFNNRRPSPVFELFVPVEPLERVGQAVE